MIWLEVWRRLLKRPYEAYLTCGGKFIIKTVPRLAAVNTRRLTRCIRPLVPNFLSTASFEALSECQPGC
jgi:hypothetical protein